MKHAVWCALAQAGALAGALCACAAQAGDDRAGVTLAVKALPKTGGGMLYRYSLHNGSAHIVVGLVIDSGEHGGSGGNGGPPAGDSAVPEPAPKAPGGWRGVKISTEEMSYLRVEWRGSPQNGIRSGQTSAGFEISTSRPNPLYLHPRWTVDFADAPPVSDQL